MGDPLTKVVLHGFNCIIRHIGTRINDTSFLSNHFCNPEVIACTYCNHSGRSTYNKAERLNMFKSLCIDLDASKTLPASRYGH